MIPAERILLPRVESQDTNGAAIFFEGNRQCGFQVRNHRGIVQVAGLDCRITAGQGGVVLGDPPRKALANRNSEGRKQALLASRHILGMKGIFPDGIEADQVVGNHDLQLGSKNRQGAGQTMGVPQIGG